MARGEQSWEAKRWFLRNSGTLTLNHGNGSAAFQSRLCLEALARTFARDTIAYGVSTVANLDCHQVDCIEAAEEVEDAKIGLK